MKTRIENDSIGALEVPAGAYYGVQTLRGHENFQITGKAMSYEFVKNVVRIKKAAARVNGEHGYVPKQISEAMITACDEILSGKFKDDFITDAIQGGAGTFRREIRGISLSPERPRKLFSIHQRRYPHCREIDGY